METEYQYDIFIIGGGSGGLSAAKWAAKSGVKVGLADFVKPSPVGTKWGIGGTCVNVGCIPKKLMHYTSLLGESIMDQKQVGWNLKQKPINNWKQMVQKIQLYIRQLNGSYKNVLRVDKVTYFNKLAKLISPNQIELTDINGIKQIVTTKYVVIATGGRPTYPDEIPGAKEYSITSDDIFWLSTKPGKTLIIGASYIALECAGFMHGLGIDVTVMVRSIFLRGFDQQLANKLGNYLRKIGIKFIRDSVPIKITLAQNNLKIVEYKTHSQKNEIIQTGEYETVLFAIGRSADSSNLGLKDIGVKVAANGKIIAGVDDSTTVPNIFAIGDVVNGRLELTPTAIMAGKLLIKRLFQGQKQTMDYKYVPTTVFTPLQYGCCGYSEEDAIKTFGKQNIIAYGSIFKPLEWNMNYKKEDDCYAKVVVLKNDQKIPNRIIGFHYLGPNAGQITQGFAVAVKKGISKQDLDNSVGIHPTIAEEFVLLRAVAGSTDELKKGC